MSDFIKTFLLHRCNGIVDCPSGNDEKNCPTQACSSSQFKCETNDVCIPKVWTCDGDADCHDNSDEENCHERKCFETEFRCSTGRCVPSTWVSFFWVIFRL